LAGTASQYSTKAMPQLASTTVGSGLSLNFRWPYQAKVMKTLDANSIRIGSSVGETVGIDVLLQKCGAAQSSGAVPRSLTRYHLISIMRKPAVSA
jgi:hypothetical protein